MSWRVLYVAYPMVAVTQAVAGGAEQMLWTLEREMWRRGHPTSVAACAGSRVAGSLLATGEAPAVPDRYEQRRAEHDQEVLRLIREDSQASPGHPHFDLIHDQSGHFWRRAGETDLPVLATLHLPRSMYPAGMFEAVPENVHFNCVSESQLSHYEGVPRMLGAVANGIRIADFPPPARERGGYLLWLGRICEEKGAHVAIAVARRAGLPLVLAGEVHAYSYHQRYFEREIAPHVDGEHVRLARSPSFRDKVGLLHAARAVLVPSLVEETSSLVAMEAGVCGTPVVGFRRGAIPEVVRDGVSGFVVDTEEEMAAAAARIHEIDPWACREHVARNFSSQRMADEYERFYARVIQAGVSDRASAQCQSNAAD